MSAVAETADRSSYLRRVLWVDAATCLAMGVLLVIAAAPLSEFLGLPARLLSYAGVALFPVALFMGWVALRESLSVGGAWVVILGNAGWVAGSVAALLVFSPTAIGYAFVLVQAVAVALLAELEYVGLRRAENS
ncbi:MAG: hypothetical protein AB7N24_23130 [Dehalococcoidia bacterium]